MKEEKDLLNENKVVNVIKDLKEKKEKDLLMIHKFEESIKHKYDTMIKIFENLKKQINEIKKNINKSFTEFKSEYIKDNFEPNSLLQTIEESFNATNRLNLTFYPFFNQNQVPENIFICKFFNFKKYINNLKQPISVSSNSFSYFFHDYSIIVFPYGIQGFGNKLRIGIKYNSEIERKYEIKVNLEIINKNSSKNVSYNLILSLDQKNISISNALGDVSNLEKNGFIHNGNLIIKCRFDHDKNNYLYDINEYYEKNIKKDISNEIKDNINEKGEKKFLGKKKEKEEKEKENNKEDSNNKNQ